MLWPGALFTRTAPCDTRKAMIYLVALSVVFVAILGVVVLVEYRVRKRRGEAIAAADGSRKPPVDHYEPTAGTTSTRKSKRKKQKRDSYAFHPVPPAEHEANRKRAGLVGETRIRRRRDHDTSDSSTAWPSSSAFDNSTRYDSAPSQDSTPYDSASSQETSSSSTYDAPSYDNTSYESSSDYGSSDSDSSWSSSSDSSSGGDFGGGGSSDSY